MSPHSSQVDKTAARERLRAEREREAKRRKALRQAVVTVSAVAVLAAVGGASHLVMEAAEPSGWEAAKEAVVVKPRNTEGENGTTVVIGKPTATKTLEVYEDPRCPICASFEQAAGETLKKDVDAGKYKVRFVGGTFIDTTARGEGAKNALSALGAALDVSPEAFLDYKSALYSANFHPEENDDKFARDDYLIEVAGSVPALRNNAAFAKAVRQGTFDAWALKMSAAFDASGVTGTPTLMMDGEKIVAEGTKNAPMTAEQFTTAIAKALRKQSTAP
ncbi:DsbA family protein [Streptomyces gulbargensis]|uniref:DsbA family protein n=1 Tax=Streptomyces gulbargensis TaxID=364901 RepID=A0ABP7MP70_9ACTN